MSLSYAVVYKDVRGVTRYKFNSHPTCFGYLTSASYDVPVGSDIQNVIYISTFMGEKDFKKAYGELVKAMPTVTVNGDVLQAPTVSYYTQNSKRFGAVDLFGARSYLRVKLPKGIKVGAVYSVMKLYLKHLTRPAGGSHHTSRPVAEYFAAGRKLFAELNRPFNPLYVMAAMGLTSGLLNYQYPFCRGRLMTNVVKRYFAGDVRITFDEVYIPPGYSSQMARDYSRVYAIKKPDEGHHINVSYIPGMEPATFKGTMAESDKLALTGDVVVLRDLSSVNPDGSVLNVMATVKDLLNKVG